MFGVSQTITGLCFVFFNLEKGVFELLSRELGLDCENGWLSSLKYKLLLTQQAIERRLNRSHSWNYLMATTEDMNFKFGKYAFIAHVAECRIISLIQALTVGVEAVTCVY